MKNIVDLDFGFADAENYKRRENKELLNKIFIRNQQLDKLCDPAVSFLMGEKGTGKTAYAVYLRNNNYKNNLADIRYIRETEYKKFISLKNQKNLELSDYTSIWKVIIYLLMSQHIIARDNRANFLRRFTKLANVEKAIDEYYNGAFSPEILQALEFVQESKLAAETLAKFATASGEQKRSYTFSESRFQTNLFYIQKQFEEAISQVRSDQSHILFIDGIDIRPESIPYVEYLDCIKGLANAVWEVNNDFFPSIKGGAGRCRCVLLIRPDIFESLGLQNQNTKSSDNSVFLDWRTEYASHRNSELFKVTEHLLNAQQDEYDTSNSCWDSYFPWDSLNVQNTHEGLTSFITVLRASYYRPRDVVTMLKIAQRQHIETGNAGKNFSEDCFTKPEFRREYSKYLLGEIKDHLTFYYSSQDYELFLKFFERLNGKSDFNYTEYIEIFNEFIAVVNSGNVAIPEFMNSANAFLQFLFDLNIISYVEYLKIPNGRQDKHIRWCFRERTYGNIAPKVKEGAEYQIFKSLYKALNVGREYTPKQMN